MAASVAAAREGSQCAIVLTGGAGIGKSALLGALAERAASAGMLVLGGVGAEHEREVPFAVVVDALDDHVGTIHARRLESLGPERVAELAGVLPSVASDGGPSGPIGGAAERFRHYRSLRSLLGMLARERPVALVLDDLHWADEASVELVLHLLRRPVEGPLLLAVAMRPVAATDPVVDAIRHAGRDGALLALAPLAVAAAQELAAGVGDARMRDRVVREAAGNPLFLRELAHVEGERLPGTLLAAVRLELDALTPTARVLAEGAAVAGDPFDLGLAAVAAGMEEPAASLVLDLLVGADLLRMDGAQLRFRHPVIRRAVYEAAPAGKRLAGHERVTQELELRGAGPVQRAHHVVAFARPGDEEAVALLSHAARSVHAQAPGAAARWYRAALALLGPDAPGRAALEAALAGALADAGELAPAHAVLSQLLARGALEGEQRARIVAECAGLEQILGRHGDAQRRLEHALGELPAVAPAAIRAGLTFELAAAAAHREDLPALVAVAGGASELAGEQAPALWVADQSLVSSAAIYTGQTAAAAAAAERGAERFDRLSDDELEVRPEAAYYLGWAQIHLMRLGQAAATTSRGLDVARRAQQGRWIPLLAALAAIARLNRCEVAGALAALEIAEESSRLQGLANALGWTLWMQALAHDMAGDAARARRLAEECLRVAAGLEQGGLERSARCAVALVHARADPERCLREIKSAAGDDVELMEPQRSTTLLAALVAAAAAVGDLHEARRCLTVLDTRTGVLGLEIGRARARAAHAVVLLAEGDAPAAVAHARAAVATAAQLGVTVDEIAAWLTLGRALAAAGRRDEAIAELRGLEERAAALGAMRDASAAAHELRALGVPRSRRPASRHRGRGDLSAREREVAALAAAGQSNKEIAAALFVSVKTVEHHLSSAFTRMGVHSRIELARAWSGDD
jgi:DNA-binding NarL/FixJ family response regulator